MSEKSKTRGVLDWRAVLGIVLSIGFIVWAFRGISFSRVLHEIAAANPFWYLGAVFMTTFPFWVRTWRWKSLIRPVYPETTFGARFRASMIGFMGNNVFPSRAGEFLRAWVLSRLEPVPMVTCLGSIAVERVFDGIALVVLTFVALAGPSFPSHSATGEEMHRYASVLAIVFGSVGLVFGALVIAPQRMVGLIERFVARFLPDAWCRPIVDSLESLLAALAAFRSPLLLLRLVVWSFVLWLLGALSYWIGLRAFGIRVPFLAALFLQSVTSFAVAVPSSPGFFGVFEWAVKTGLVGIWNVDASRALSFAIGFHIAGYIPVTVIGAYYVGKLGLSWKQVGKGEEAVEDEVEHELSAAGDKRRPASGGRS